MSKAWVQLSHDFFPTLYTIIVYMSATINKGQLLFHLGMQKLWAKENMFYKKKKKKLQKQQLLLNNRP